MSIFKKIVQMEIPYQGRAIIDERFDGLEITIPSKKNWFLILFLSFWLCGWTLGEFSALKTVFVRDAGAAPELFMVFWLCGWTVGGLFALRALIWMLAGSEKILIEQGTLTVDRKAAIPFKAKIYDLREAKNFRVQEDILSNGPFGTTRTNPLNFANNGTIRFDYGMQTVKFGDGIDEAEALHIVEKMRSKKLIS